MGEECGDIGVELKIWLCPSHSFPIAAPPSGAPARPTCRDVRAKPAFCAGEQEQPGACTVPWDEQARLGHASHPARALVPAGSTRPCSARQGRRDHSGCPGCQTSGAFHVGRGDVIQVASIQGGAFFPSGSTHRSSPSPTQKKTRTQKTLATLLIYSRFLPLSQWATSCRTPE